MEFPGFCVTVGGGGGGAVGRGGRCRTVELHVCRAFVCVRASRRRAVLQIASVPNYTVLMKACSPGGPTKERLGTSPLTLSKDEREREGGRERE